MPSPRWIVVGVLCAATWLTACSGEPSTSTPKRAPSPATTTLPADDDAALGTVTSSVVDASHGGDAALRDAGPPDGAPPHATVKECFQDLVGPVAAPDYDQFAPKMGTHCAGTHQQTIAGVEKVVFLGDSITAGTPPTPSASYYRQLVVQGLGQRFGAQLTSADCSKWGARIGDLKTPAGSSQPGQIEQCFPSGVEQKKTLIVMTMGANDVSAWAKDQLTAQAATIEADAAASKLGAALTWLKDPAHFPNGSWVVFGNTYEYTDSSGDLLSCPAAGLSGFKNEWSQGTSAVLHFQELFMKHAVATGTDLVFLLENFCGHGYRRSDPALQCYRGPNAELWFDLTCYHPNPAGHAKIAEYMLRVVDG